MIISLINKLCILIFNIYFYLMLIVIGIIMGIISTVTLTLYSLFVPKYKVIKMLRQCIVIYGKILHYLVFFPFVRIYFEDLSSESNTKPGLFVINHRSASDPFLMAVLPGEFVQIVNDWPFKIPFLGIVAKLADYLNIKEMNFDNFSDKIENLIKNNISVVSFPEGTRSGEGEMGQFNGAVFRIAKRIKCPIYPVCIIGNENSPDLSFKMHPGKIKIRKYPDITKDIDIDKYTAFQLKKYVRKVMLENIEEMENK